MMYTALTYDHRLIDGREAATFLKNISKVINKIEYKLLNIIKYFKNKVVLS